MTYLAPPRFFRGRGIFFVYGDYRLLPEVVFDIVDAVHHLFIDMPLHPPAGVKTLHTISYLVVLIRAMVHQRLEATVKKRKARCMTAAPKKPNHRLLLYCKADGWQTGYYLKGSWFTSEMTRISPCFWALLPSPPRALSHRLA
jgi:hypothetical protein